MTVDDSDDSDHDDPDGSPGSDVADGRSNDRADHSDGVDDADSVDWVPTILICSLFLQSIGDSSSPVWHRFTIAQTLVRMDQIVSTDRQTTHQSSKR